MTEPEQQPQETAAPPPPCGRLTVDQYNVLSARINPNRVREHDDGTPWIEGNDVRRWLNRIFGFCGWGTEILRADVLCSEQIPAEHDETKTVWQVTRETAVRLTLRAADGSVLTFFDGASACTVTDASLGQAHNDAANTAETWALKRAAANLGDQFGLGLRSGVLIHAYVGGALPRPDGATAPAWYARAETEPAPERDCTPAEADDTPRPVTPAEGIRRVAAATLPAVVRSADDIRAALEASIQRARETRDAEAVPVLS